mmetsp:Transcript_10847/g.22126  ORF Transcript_10847/g.22126 Transcript_10847/m.22126 type:complete len:293 (+) Transcript_10847:1222-2100(+)
MENGPRRKRTRSPCGMLTSSHKHNRGSQAQNSASTKLMTSSNGFDSKPSMRSSCLCSRSKKASTRRAVVLTMPSGSSKACETSSMGGNSVKSGIGGGSLLPLSFGVEAPLVGDFCCAPAAWTSRPCAESFPCSDGLAEASLAAWSSSGSMSTTSCAPSSCTLHLALLLSNSTRSPCFPLASSTTRWPGDSATLGRFAPAASGTASRFCDPTNTFSPLLNRIVHRSCWSSSSRSPCFPFSSGASCKRTNTTCWPGSSGALLAPASWPGGPSSAGALRCWRRRIHSSSSVRRKL